ncbi:MAG TPA: ABC transporter transmembrane domain-containing protein, partial [Acidimicrobiales bacterium]|nr:ABC transporter transmembrane domain-containing protein [Acidimicrobiales bacterium]
MAERTIEIPDGGEARRVTFTGPVEIGREGVDVVVDDTEVSRRHARLEPTDQGVLVADLGSTNGTWVDGRRVEEPVLVRPGQLIGVGRTNVLVVDDSRLAHLAALPSGPAVVRYVPGTAGEAAAPAVAAAVAEAAQRLGGLLPPDLPTVQVCLVDPFPDPSAPGRILDEGTVVDADRAEIWMVTTALVAPEPVDRPLAVLAAARVGVDPGVVPLYGGVALDRLGAPDPEPLLHDVDLPPLAEATGELQASMAVSFVRHLVRRGGDEALHRYLAGASAEDVYGVDRADLEDEWRAELAGDDEPVEPVRFVRIALRYLRPHRWRQAEIFAYMLLGLAFTVVFPFAFQRLIDGPLTPDEQGRLGEFSDVVPILGLVGAVFVVSLVADLRRAYVSAVVSNSVVRQLRQEIFDRLQVLEMAWFGRHQQGDVYGRLFTDVNVLEQGLSQAVRDGMFQALSLVVTAAVLVKLNWQLALIVLVGAPLVAVVYRFMAGGAQERSIAVQEEMSQVMGVAAENYAAQPVVKAFGLERRESDRFDEASGRLLKAEVRLELFGGMFGLSVNMIVTVLRIVVMATGAWLIVNGDLTPGAFVAFISLMGQVLAPVTVLTTVGQQIQESGGALARINEVLEAVPAIADRPGAVDLAPLRSEIRLTGVGFGYTPDRRILHDVDLTIAAGTKVAFVGPSGAGKSSVMQLLTRFYDPDEGTVT